MTRSLQLLSIATVLCVASACETEASAVEIETVHLVLDLDPSGVVTVDGLAAPGDLDGDGADDLVVASHEVARLHWFGGSEGFDGTSRGSIPLEAPGLPLAPGDLDGDGYPDVVVAGQSRPVVLLAFAGGPEGLGAVTMAEVVTDQVGDVPLTVAAAGDIDGDATPDILVREEQGVWVYDVASGTGELQVACSSCDRFAESLAGPGDMDADGYDDAIVQTPHGYVLLRGGAQGLEVGTYLLYAETEGAGACWAAGDINGDGAADAACVSVPPSYGDEEPGVFLLFGAPTGASEPVEWPTVLGREDLPDVVTRAGDADHDGIDDALVGIPDADRDQGGVLLYAGGEAGPGAQPASVFPGEEMGVRLGEALVGDLDLDADGWSDMVTVATDPATGSQEARLYLGADRARP